MNKKLFSAMSRRRVSSPEMVQHLWDAVKVTRCQRQVPNIDRITRYMVRVHNVSEDEVARQLNYCVRDNLLELTKRVNCKGVNVGLEQEGYKISSVQVEKDGHDWYCLECHSGGDVICCNTCHRVYHLSCIAKNDLPDDDVKHKFICAVCKSIHAAIEAPSKLKKRKLNRLLRYTCSRLKEKLPVPIIERQILTNPTFSAFDRISVNPVKRASSEVSNGSKWVLEEDNSWRIKSLIYVPMDLETMKSKTIQKRYNCVEEFRADAQTLVHNVVIYHGVHSNIADMARQMLRDCDHDLQEIRQCYHCYRESNEKHSKHWFCTPCRPPHELVYAKQKGFPYWPAKVIKKEGDIYDVRFFGIPHERGLIEKTHIRPISVNIHALQVNRTSSWIKACEELKRHQVLLDRLRAETNNFSRIPQDSSSDSEDEASSPEKSVCSSEPCAASKKPIATPVAAPVSPDDKHDSPDSWCSDTPDAPNVKDSEAELETPVKTSKRGRPRSESNKVTKKKLRKLDLKAIESSVKKKRGRPKKSVRKESSSFLESSSPPPLISNDLCTSDVSTGNILLDIKKEECPEETVKSVDEDAPQLNPPVDIEVIKKEEEEVVSSSCQGVESPSLVQSRNIGIQTNIHDKKPSKDWINKMRLEFEMEEKRTIERLEKQHREELEAVREQHQLAVADVKKKQWCYNCEMEAIYHCCWNTSYCSIECQQIHWQREHKRVCRRKR